MNKGTALLTGSTGQLGRELIGTVPPHWSLHACSAAEADITSFDAVRNAVSRLRPEVILNAAGYTAVDRAEQEPERAFDINQTGVRNLALVAKEFGCRVLHLSTDFVFNGSKRSPYTPSDAPEPLGIYGSSKLAGEHELTGILPDRSTIIRTAWLYSAGGRNFVHTIIRLLREREQLDVVSDQVGSPTYARGLAVVIWKIADDPTIVGVYHWVDQGATSWYDFALAIREESERRGLLTRNTPIRPVSSADYPTEARRPAYSVLDASLLAERLGVAPTHWRINLTRMFEELLTLANQ